MAKKASPLTKTAWLDKHGLPDRRRAFVLAYLKTKNLTQSAKEAGYRQPQMQGPRLMKKDEVQAAVDEGLAKIEAAAQVDAEKVVEGWWTTWSANPADLSSVQRHACRYCYGIDHAFQWRTQREFDEALTEAAEKIANGSAELFEKVINGDIEDKRIPLKAGGFGYTTKARPNPDCPECDGEGIESVYIADTRDLSPEAAVLFDGAKVNAKGHIEVNQLDRAKALENIAKHLGMFTAKVDSEETNPLAQALTNLMAKGSTAPVIPDDVARERMRRAGHSVTVNINTAEQEEEEP